MRWAQTLIAVTALSTAAPATAELDLNRAEVTHLPDGLTVIMLEDNSFPVVSVQMLYKSGSAAETTGKTGLAHFMEHLAFRGSQNFPNESATELIYDAGGEWHGYTAFDQTTYFATMPKDGLDLLLKIEADRMARTVIDPASMEAERGRGHHRASQLRERSRIRSSGCGCSNGDPGPSVRQPDGGICQRRRTLNRRRCAGILCGPLRAR